MAAAVLLRSVARKMSRAAAPTHYHPSLVARGLHGGASSRPADSKQINQMQKGTADALAALQSGAGWLTTTKMAQTPPPPYHRLVHGRGIHSRTSPDPIPSSPQKVLGTTSAALNKVLDKGTAGLAYIALVSAAIYVHYWVKPKVDEVTAKYEDLCRRTSHLIIQQDGTLTVPISAGPGNKTQQATGANVMHFHGNRVKELEATIMNLEAEIAELKDSARSQGKVV